MKHHKPSTGEVVKLVPISKEHIDSLLKTYKIEEKYVNNFLQYYDSRKKWTKDDMIAFIIYHVQNGNNNGLLSSAFDWSKTNEGSRYWSFMQDAWRRYLYKNNFSY